METDDSCVYLSFLFKDKKSKWESCRGLYNENESIETFFTFEIDLYIPAAMSHVISNVCQLFLLTVMSSRKMFKTARIFSCWLVHSSPFISPKRKVNPCDFGARISREFGSPFPSHSGQQQQTMDKNFYCHFFSPSTTR